MKIEAQAARAARHGIGLRARLVAELPRYARVAAALAPLANLRNRVPALARLGERARAFRPAARCRRGAATGCAMPPRPATCCCWPHVQPVFRAGNLRAAQRVLRAAGFKPVIAGDGGRPLCCGRTYLAAGMVDRARAEAKRMLAALAGIGSWWGWNRPAC